MKKVILWHKVVGAIKAFEQVKWERDIAIEQLKSYGVGFCENKELVEVVRCKDCKYRRELDCPMYHEELEDCDDGDYVYIDIVATDNTVDDGFCHRGEKIESEVDK